MARGRKYRAPVQSQSREPALARGEPNSDGLNPLEHGHVAGVGEEETSRGQAELEAEEGASEDGSEVESPTIAQVQARMLEMERRHSEELSALRRQQAPTTPKSDQPPVPEEDNMDDLLFTNPKEAIKKIKEQVGREIETKLTARYSQAENTKKFWTAFDKKYPDLTEDRDIVEMTMNANLADIANIPIDKAMEKIAELTRGRIQRYTSTRPKPKRAFAEGGGSPLPKPEREEAPAVVSIGELIRRRRAGRHGKASAA